MRILCLHGKGTSARIFQSQTTSLRRRLEQISEDLTFEFDFVDGPLPSAPAPDTPSFYEPPYYAFYEGNSITGIRESHQWLSDILDQRGPYDGVLTFSQGCALISSYMLYQQWYEPEENAPFKFALFICGGVPITVLKDLGVPVSKEVENLDSATKLQLLEKTTCEVTKDRWQLTDYANVVRRAQFDSDDCFGLNLNKIPPELKIRIPTVHVYGRKDPRLPASVQLAGLCDPYIRTIFDHGGGHEIPRSTDVSDEMAKLIVWAAQRGVWPGQE